VRRVIDSEPIDVVITGSSDLELLRRVCDLGYGLTADRQELDFVARQGDDTARLRPAAEWLLGSGAAL